MAEQFKEDVVPRQEHDDLQKLKEYYVEHNVNLDSVMKTTQAGATRFIRLNPRFNKEETIQLIKLDLSSPVSETYPKRVPWLDSISSSTKSCNSLEFYALPADFRLAQSNAYKTGRIYGQDVSSGAAVAALMDPSPFPTTKSTTHKDGDDAVGALAMPSLRILDLCCAPGLKLCAIADWLEQSTPVIGQASATVVGVDLSGSRLDVTKNVIYKYQLDPKTRGDESRSCLFPRIRLYQGDGASFAEYGAKEDNLHNLVFDSQAAMEEDRCERKRTNKSSRARERKRLELLQEEDSRLGSTTKSSFDRVLVDAECSTDGSLKHVQKILQGARNDVSGGILPLLSDCNKMEELLDLQKRLACQGFRLLKPGGYMVYSTCSLSQQQNEEIVEKVLESFGDAILVPIPLAGFGKSNLVSEGAIKGTLRFLPNTGSNEFFGGGFFLARFRKVLSSIV